MHAIARVPSHWQMSADGGMGSVPDYIKDNVARILLMPTLICKIEIGTLNAPSSSVNCPQNFLCLRMLQHIFPQPVILLGTYISKLVTAK